MPQKAQPNTPNPLQERLSESWLDGLSVQVGREVSLARENQREIHGWVITLSVGSVVAVWAVGGGTFNYPTESSFIVALVMLPLVLRFFARGCLEYQVFHRWVAIRDALNVYYFTRDVKPRLKQAAMASLIENIRLYYFQWLQPRSNRSMIWDNLTLVYRWPILLLVALIVLGAVLQPITRLISYALIPVGLLTGWELVDFFRYFYGKHKEPLHKLDRTLL